MDGELPEEVGLRFPPAICTRDICPCSGVEALPDLGVVLHRVQQLEREVVSPPRFINDQLVSHQWGNAHLTRTLFAWFPSTVPWLPSVGVGASSFFAFFGFDGAAAFLGVVEVVLARAIAVAKRRASVGRIKYVLYLFYLFSKQGPGGRESSRESGEFRLRTRNSDGSRFSSSHDSGNKNRVRESGARIGSISQF